jgi:hypothetical protein
MDRHMDQMSLQRLGEVERPRELRRRVALPARVSTGQGWADASILNVSSRGFLIRSGRTVPAGATLQLLRGDQLITARVMWSDGARSGLRAVERIAVEEILSSNQTAGFQLAAIQPNARNSRRVTTKPAPAVPSRALEFVGVSAIAIMLAAAAFLGARQTLAPPLAKISAALSSQF